jgi:hypothetical protein
MKIKYEKNFCRQVNELATSNRWNYFDISHIWVYCSKSGPNNLILMSSENTGGTQKHFLFQVVIKSNLMEYFYKYGTADTLTREFF